MHHLIDTKCRMSRLSSYAEGLSDEAKERYKGKLSIIGGIDLFLSDIGILANSFPPVESIDTVSYLVLWTSFVTAEQLKARKGFETYDQFVSGWVKDVNNRKVCCHWQGKIY